MPEKMEIKLYRESINRKTGKGVGDDALPYIGDRLMSVADGAGGRAYALQPDINPLLTEPEVSFETAVAGIIPPDDIRRDLYKQQYMENFFNEGFSLSADYTESGGRKSSYFGSRLASILIRRLIDMYLPEEELESFFNDLHERPEDEREKVLRELGDGFARELYAQMQQAADNCHLAFGETVSVSNVNLMSTTYSGIVFRESEEYVDVLTIQAGDSLPYALVMDRQKDAAVLKLLQKAQERDDGGMTNCVCADAPFRLPLSYHRIQKPCALMCATDGCFDAFSTPAHFERFVLDNIRTGLQAGNLDEAADKMKQFFMSGASTDDSSSLVLKIFDASLTIRIGMQNRSAMLSEKLNLDNPAWYSEAELPEDNLKALDIARDQTIVRFKNELLEKSAWLQDAVWGSCRETEEEAERKAQMREMNLKAMEDARKELEEQVRAAWPVLQNRAQPSSFGFQHVNARIAERKNRMRELGTERRRIFLSDSPDSLKSLKDRIFSAADSIVPEEAQETEKASEYIGEVCGRLKGITADLDKISQTVSYFDDRMAECRKGIEEAEEEMRGEDALLIRLYCLLLTGDIREPNRLAQMPSGPAEQYAEEARNALTEIPGCEDVTTPEILELLDELEGIQDIRPEGEGVRAALEKIYEAKRALRDTGDEARKKKMGELRREYLDRPLKLARECVLEHMDTIEPDLAEALAEALKSNQEEREKILTLLTEKREAVAAYREEYESLLSQEVSECP